MFILNHTRLLSPRFLHFILLNFITSSFTLLHLCFAFLLIRNFCVFYQNQCSSASSQVLSFKFLNTIFFSCTSTFVYFSSFHFFSFWSFLVYRMQICFGLKNNFFFFKAQISYRSNLKFRSIFTKTPKIGWNDLKIFLKWNRVSYCFGLFIGTVFSGCYGQNKMELITLNQT